MNQNPKKQAEANQTNPPADGSKMYKELALWWHLLSAPEEYEEEAAFFQKVLSETGQHPPETLLELGSGGGNNASHLKAHFKMTLVDRSPEMLAASRGLNPTCEHIEGDMRTVRLNRQFDTVFIHDAIAYMTTLVDLRQALSTAYIHCRAGGIALFAPDDVRENFTPTTQHGGHTSVDRAMRYLEWCYDPDETDSTVTTDFVFILRTGEEVQVVHDRHICGLFARADWLRLLREVGFETRVVV